MDVTTRAADRTICTWCGPVKIKEAANRSVHRGPLLPKAVVTANDTSKGASDNLNWLWLVVGITEQSHEILQRWLAVGLTPSVKLRANQTKCERSELH